MENGIIHPNASLSKLIFSSFLFISLGILLELYLLEHFEDTLQLTPILCISGSMLIFCSPLV